MKKFLSVLICILLVVPVFSQSATAISEILLKERASYMDMSYLVTAELGMNSTPFEAYTWCERFGSFPVNVTPDSPITVKMLSFFLMENYEINGGLMWSITHSPRYAWKELKSTGFWRIGFDPDRELSGRELVNAVSRFFESNPDAKLREPPAAEASHNFRELLLKDKEDK